MQTALIRVTTEAGDAVQRKLLHGNGMVSDIRRLKKQRCTNPRLMQRAGKGACHQVEEAGSAGRAPVPLRPFTLGGEGGGRRASLPRPQLLALHLPVHLPVTGQRRLRVAGPAVQSTWATERRPRFVFNEPLGSLLALPSGAGEPRREKPPARFCEWGRIPVCSRGPAALSTRCCDEAGGGSSARSRPGPTRGRLSRRRERRRREPEVK